MTVHRYLASSPSGPCSSCGAKIPTGADVYLESADLAGGPRLCATCHAAGPAPYYQDDDVTLHHGDCLDVLRRLPDASVDSVVTDPPYGISFMGKQWDQPGQYGSTSRRGGGPNRRRGGQDAALEAGRYDLSSHAMRNFQAWCEAWATECLRVLKPGGHLVAFGGSRTWHRLAGGIEDAGFEIRDSIAWLYGSGFPKSMNVAKAIDKARTDADEMDEVRAFLDAVRRDRGIDLKAINRHFGFADNGGGLASTWTTNRTSKAIPTWEQWLNLKEWLGFGDEVDHLVRTLEDTRLNGTDAWNSRPEVEASSRPGMATSWCNGVGWSGKDARGGSAIRDDAKPWEGWGTALKPAFEPIVVGRKPLAGTVAANVLAHGTGALNIDATRTATTDAEKAAINAKHAGMDLATYERRPGDALNLSTNPMPLTGAQAHDGGRWPTNVVLTHVPLFDGETGEVIGDACADRCVPGCRVRELGDKAALFPAFRYEAKAAKHERPRSWMHACQCPHDLPMEPDGECLTCGTPGRLIGHPTVKPLSLMGWLARLVTPPGGKVLEVFSGSGTTAEACVIEGLRCIAIEREADYLPLTIHRVTKPLQVGLDFGKATA